MKIQEPVMNGYLTVYKEFADGSREYILEDDKNVITMAARREHLAYLHDYAGTPRNQLDSFKIGRAGAVGDDSQGNSNVIIIPPDPTRNDLYDPIVIPGNTDITLTPSDPADDSAVYLLISFTINQDEANGERINECGVFLENGNMFNHKTFANIEKTESFSVIFQWYLRYV